VSSCSTNRIYISRDVIFDEHVFPFSQTPHNSKLQPSPLDRLHPNQFVDAAYNPLLLANHVACSVCGEHQELLDEVNNDHHNIYH
jgi:hypothetical protein